MIEVIEKGLIFNNLFFGEYKKAWVIILQQDKVMTLTSKTTFQLPASKKRWRLKSRFLKEGCIVNISFLQIPNKGRKKYWLSLDEIIKIGNITNKTFIEELKIVDNNTEKELRMF